MQVTFGTSSSHRHSCFTSVSLCAYSVSRRSAPDHRIVWQGTAERTLSPGAGQQATGQYPVLSSGGDKPILFAAGPSLETCASWQPPATWRGRRSGLVFSGLVMVMPAMPLAWFWRCPSRQGSPASSGTPSRGQQTTERKLLVTQRPRQHSLPTPFLGRLGWPLFCCGGGGGGCVSCSPAAEQVALGLKTAYCREAAGVLEQRGAVLVDCSNLPAC